jgi:K+-sensing histidine kinase KdpD
LVRAIAHNLRQPLMALEMNLATILKLTQRDGIHGEQILEAIDDARLAERRMAMSLQALEDLAVARRKRHEPMDVGEIVREVIDLVDTNIRSSHARAEAEVEAELPPIVGDAAMVREAILSLTLSAVDHVIAAPSATAAHATATREAPRIIVAARRDDADHIAIAVEHELRQSADLPAYARTWDTSIATAVSGLHHGSFTIETDERRTRATMRWAIDA